MRQLVYTVFTANNHASFHLSQKKNLVKYQEILKYYDHHRNTVYAFLHCFTEDRQDGIFLSILNMKKHLSPQPFCKSLNRISHHPNSTVNKIWIFKISKMQIFKSNFSHDFPLERTRETILSVKNGHIFSFKAI